MGDAERAALEITLSPDIDAVHLKRELEEDRETDSAKVAISAFAFFGNGSSLLHELIEWFTLVGQVLQKLRNLKVVLSVDDYFFPYWGHRRTPSMPLRAIGEILRLRYDTLVTLHLEMRGGSIDVLLSDDGCDFFMRQLGQAKKLQKFHLGTRVTNEARFFGTLWSTLSEIETLREVSVAGMRQVIRSDSALIELCQQSNSQQKPTLCVGLGNTTFSPGVLQALYRDNNSRISALKLNHVTNLNKALLEATAGLKDNTALKRLNFWFPDDRLYDFVPYGIGTTLLRSLEKNTGLETLSVAIRVDPADPCGGKLTEAVHKIGQPLKKLELCLRVANNSEGDGPVFSSVAAILHGLGENTSLIELHICTCYSGQNMVTMSNIFGFNEKLASVLETNTTLQEVVLSNRRAWEKPTPLELNPTVHFWLKLNRVGRTCVFEDREHWVGALVEHAEDHSILFHLILNNPSYLVSSFAACTAKKPGYLSGRTLKPPKKKQKLKH